MLIPGRQVGGFIVERVLGTGGLAVVYLVRDPGSGQRWALKVLSLKHPSLEARMLLEGQVQAALCHPNVVPVVGTLTVDDTLALLMEVVDGPTLERWLRERRPGLAEAEAIFQGLLDGVACAHGAGFVHRDLKPANILMQRAGATWIPRITDFGLARLIEASLPGARHTRTGLPLGTPRYMAPEQIRDARGADHRADIFALGAILYELCCGRPAFEGDDLLALFNAASDGRYRDPGEAAPGLPPRLVAAIRGALVADREGRIPDCATLGRVARGEQAWPPMPPPPVPPRSREPRWLAALAAGAALVALAAVVAVAWHGGSNGEPVSAPAPDPEPAALLAAVPGDPPPTAAEDPIPQPQPAAPAPAMSSRRPEPATPATPDAGPPAEADAVWEVEGDATEVWLERDGRRFPPGAVPAGHYRVLARFDPGGVRDAGEVWLASGTPLRLRCKAAFRLCTSLGSP